jgi:hypothetical protein
MIGDVSLPGQVTLPASRSVRTLLLGEVGPAVLPGQGQWSVGAAIRRQGS